MSRHMRIPTWESSPVSHLFISQPPAAPDTGSAPSNVTDHFHSQTVVILEMNVNNGNSLADPDSVEVCSHVNQSLAGCTLFKATPILLSR